jgi:hypothetical protein
MLKFENEVIVVTLFPREIAGVLSRSAMAMSIEIPVEHQELGVVSLYLGIGKVNVVRFGTCLLNHHKRYFWVEIIHIENNVGNMSIVPVHTSPRSAFIYYLGAILYASLL